MNPIKKTVITDYKQSFDEKNILKRLGMPADHAFGEKIRELLAEAKKIAKPKALYLECPVEAKNDNSVTLNGITFYSKALAKKVEDVDLIYPYLCTCGRELADYAAGLDDMLDQFALDAIMEYYRKQITISLNGHLADLAPEGKVISDTKPGSLLGWPIQEQKKMFKLFGAYADEIGVTLNEDYLMFPVKSVTGFQFATKGVSHDCELCQRSDCPGRKVPFNMKAYLEATEY